MAYSRQIDLQSLYNRNHLSVNLTSQTSAYTATEDAGSDGISSIFDGQENTELRLDNIVSAPEGVPQEWVNLNFSRPIKAKQIRIAFITSVIQTYKVYINYGRTGNHPQQSSELITKTGDGSYETENINFNLSSFGEIHNISFELKETNSNNDHFISGVELYVLEEWENKYFEFNDSVLTTKAWNSSRYTGKQLQGAKINEYTSGDVSYANTPVIRNYTKNIYIGNNIIGLASSSLAADNSNLTPFNERFSYAQCNTFITVNDDGSITKYDLDSTANNNNKKVFYRSFNRDFNQGEKCNILITDPVVENNLKSSHNIYFSEGQFKSLFNLTPRNDDGQYVSLIYTSGSFDIINIYAGGFDNNEGIINYGVDFRNVPLTQLFYTRSLKLINSPKPNSETTDTRFHEIFEGFFNYQSNSDYKGDKRLFATFLSGSGISSNFKTLKPIILEEEENYGGVYSALRQDLSFLSTCEITSVTDSVNATSTGGTIAADTYKFHIDPKYNLSQDYQSRGDFTPVVTQGQTSFGLGAIQPQDPAATRVGGYDKGSLLFSICDDNIPSILIDLEKDVELPSGQGTKPFVIVPANLHPYIKDNLFYFLTRAGIDIGGNTSALIPLDQSKRYPDRIGWKPPKPAPTPELQAAQDAKTEITLEQLRERAAQRRAEFEKRREEALNQTLRGRIQSKREENAEKRNEKRLEREQNREERKQKRQETRQDRREDRQDRRENRRNRRRNR